MCVVPVCVRSPPTQNVSSYATFDCMTPTGFTPTHTALHFPYAWWERAGTEGPQPHVAARLREGVLAELHTVRDGRFDRPSTEAARGAPDARPALDAATSFRRVDTEWHPRLDTLRRSVEGLEAQVDQAQTLRRALMAYQVERLATAGSRGVGGVHAGMTLVEAVAERRRALQSCDP